MKPVICLSMLLTSIFISIPVSHGIEPDQIRFPTDTQTVFQWQQKPIPQPKGGDAFAASAFIHPLCTPKGFVCTDIQPSDHLHHLGFWWPWKSVEFEGKKYVTWELQNGEGQHRAKSSRLISSSQDRAEWEFLNETIVKPKDSDPIVVIEETARVGVTRRADATVVDLELRQKPVAGPVTIARYHYSGFSWRGPATWNKDNSHLLSSDGKNRDNANGTPARWLIASGSTTTGTASILILSDAENLSGSVEKLRVWGSKQHDGAPFVNFNPVVGKSIPLDEKHPAVSHRRYRIIAVDRSLEPQEAEAEWKAWSAR